MVPEPLVDVVAVRAVGGYLLELAYPHGQVRLLDPEPLLWPRAYDAVWPAAPGMGIPPVVEMAFQTEAALTPHANLAARTQAWR
jgi:hypothetical protein